MAEPSRAVFLSYASQDSQAALRICEALRAADMEVWFDRNELRGGDAWDHSIRQQIKSCALFIPIISKNTHDRDEGYFRLEWKLAIDRSHLMAADKPFLLPVVVDDTSDDDERVPERFRDVQWTRLPGGEAPPAFVERIKHLLSPGASGLIQPRASDRPPAAGTVRAQGRASPRQKSALLVAVAVMSVGFAGYFAIDKLWQPSVSSAMVATRASPAVFAPPAALYRGATIRKHERRQGTAVLLGRAYGRAAQFAGADQRPPGRSANLIVLIPGSTLTF